MKTNSILISIIILSLLPFFSKAQTNPQAEPVWGAHIEDIDNIALSATSTRVFISTLSPNTMFYSDITNTNTSSPTFSVWNVVPDLDETGNYGRLRCFAIDENSGYIFAGTEDGRFISANTTASSVSVIDPIIIEAIEAHNSRLFWQRNVGGNQLLYSADIAASGSLTNIKSSILSTGSWYPSMDIEIHVNTNNNLVYVFVSGQTPAIYKSSDPYTTISNTTTWSLISSSSIAILNEDYISMGISDDGRLYAGSYTGNSSAFQAQISYTDTDSDPWTTVIINEDCGRSDISISTTNTAGDYNIYFGRTFSTNKAASWSMFGAADGALKVDPNNMDIVHVRRDWGFGLYERTAPIMHDYNTKLQAVQVNDFTMNVAKDTAWVAAKSGIWRVDNYGTTSPVWSLPIWPQNSSVPWTSVATGLYAEPFYCGNNDGNVYRWESADGSFLDPMNYQAVFNSHATYAYYSWTYGSYVAAIIPDPYSSTERLFVGIHDAEDYNEPQHMGGVFVGTISSGVWSFSQIMTGSMTADGCDVNDIAITQEGGNTVLYVGVLRNSSYSTLVNGIYRIEETSTGVWSATDDLKDAAGIPFMATITDIWISGADTIYACGADATSSTNVIYKKAVGATNWIPITRMGLPPTGIAKSITVDVSTNDIYLAIDNIVYGLPSGSINWVPFGTYPNGTEIQFIYYDDLLVGTGTGLYAHWSSLGLMEDPIIEKSKVISASPNPFIDNISFKFDLAKGQKVTLKIYDATGKEVRTIADNNLTSGSYNLIWNSTNNAGAQVARGAYYYVLTVGSESYNGKIIR